MNMLLNLKERIQKRKETRLIKKVSRCNEKLEAYAYEVYEGAILHCPNCRASLNLYGDIYEIHDTNIVDHIECNLCGFSLTRDFGPFIPESMDKMLTASKKLDKWMDDNNNKYILRGFKLVDKQRIAQNKLIEFYMRRDGYIAECPNCKKLLNRYGYFNPSILAFNYPKNLPNYTPESKSWHCDNCGTTSVWDFGKPTPICIDIYKYKNKEEKEKLCQTKKQSDN